MNDLRRNIVNLSVYYNQAEWHLFFRNCLNPLLKELKVRNGDAIESVLLYCNTDKGDNIRLSFRINAFTIDEFMDFIRKSLQTYLTEKPSETKEIAHPIKQFFMNYPNNSIVENINLPDVMEEWQDQYIDVQTFISALILKEFEEDLIEEETCFSFTIYLLFVLFKIKLTGDNKEIINTINQLIATVESRYQERYFFKESEKNKISGYIEKVYEKNLPAINEIYLEVWEEDSSLIWISEWKSLLRKHFNDASLMDSYNIILSMLQYHLNLPDINSTSFAKWIAVTITNNLKEQLTQ
ncbi:hypothetical protein DVR12_03590 [Chitinophaga silvatica]|uniref:Thiopeptide-type bacteriocin biosynthesis domain-containing protein n=1 Tax=Chitinophaga silvatica TaxID=2282649 RepID=A0A3E1YHK8_9BACT|nr:hypothetical protein [Chitinophaga silvatica]RFS26879.1 hypothetical protein DVR12_03590 [Chitinophaga silvatica]